MSYRITATRDRNGTDERCDTAEVLGDAYGRSYPDRESAEAACRALQDSVEEYGLDPATVYEVVS